MHSAWAVPTWREGITLHLVQLPKKADQVEVGGVGGQGGRWGHCLDNRHPQRKGEAGPDDQLL